MSKEHSNSTVIMGAFSALILVGVLLIPTLFKNTSTTTPDSPSSSKFRLDSNTAMWYRNEKPFFTFQIPQGFTAPNRPLGQGKGQEVVLINAEGDDALLILVYPITQGSDQTLTEDIVRANSKDEAVSEFRKGALAEGTQGLYFSTDSQLWDGDGVAFWFIHDSYLYMLATHKEDAELLDLVMQTLHFGVPVPPLSESGPSLGRRNS